MKNGYDIRRRLMALVLSAVMIFQCMPVSALAEGEDNGGWRTFSSPLLTAEASYTIQFEVDGNIVDTLSVNQGNSIRRSDLPAPEKEGYRLTYWAKDDGTAIELPYTPTADETLHAHFEKLWTVTWVVVDEATSTEEVIDTFEVLNGSRIGEVPEAPERMNEEFAGWYDGENAITASTVPTSDIKAVALYTKDLVVRFMLEGETVDYTKPRVFVTGSKLGALPEKPFKSGYRFVGWFNGEEQVTADTDVTESFVAIGKFEDVRVFQARVSYYYLKLPT